MHHLNQPRPPLPHTSAELIRERPLAAFGVAFAAGWIIAKLARSEK